IENWNGEIGSKRGCEIIIKSINRYRAISLITNTPATGKRSGITSGSAHGILKIERIPCPDILISIMRTSTGIQKQIQAACTGVNVVPASIRLIKIIQTDDIIVKIIILGRGC